MLTIEMLPARNGDCLWITYGSGPHRHHVLIDGGYEASSELVRQRFAADAKLRLDLMILTHIDEDHILGGIQLLARDELTANRVDDVWFNGWQQLVDVPEDDDELGAKQGEYFSALLDKKGFAWNRAFAGGPICVPSNGAPPTVALKGGLKLTILSPDTSKLRTLRAKWKAELKGTKIRPGDLDAAFKLLRDDSKYDTDELGPLNVTKLADVAFSEDSTAPNGSSIAVLAEYGGKRLLLTGDAHPSVTAATLKRLGYTREKPLAVDVLKLSHHGSQNNTSRELLEHLTYRHVLVSTNGERFSHPHPQSIARVVAGREGVALHFNYTSKFNESWLDPANQKKWKYTADHGDDGTYALDVAG